MKCVRFDHEYFFSSVDPDERDRISKSVWKREPGGNRRRGDFSYGGKYGGCSHILQNSGAKAKEIWYNQGEQISGKEQEICIKTVCVRSYPLQTVRVCEGRMYGQKI